MPVPTCWRPALAAQAVRDPRWSEALEQARWALQIGRRKRRPDGTLEDWVDPETRAELERRGRLRLAVYDAADEFLSREGRAPNKREQRQLVARVIVEEEGTQQAWGAATAAFARNDREGARRWLSRVAGVGQIDGLGRPARESPPGTADTKEELVLADFPAGLDSAGNLDGVRSGGGGRGKRRRANRQRRRSESLDQDEMDLREMAQSWRARGRDRAARLLEKFLDGDDSPVVLSREEAREIEFVRIGEEENNRRFIENTFTGNTQNREITECLRGLQEGEECVIKDGYDYERNKLDSLGLGLFYYVEEQLPRVERSEELDEILSFGSHEVKSTVIFTARRNGETIEIEGTITHDASDDYDFEKDTPGHLVGARRLQEIGRATPYRIESVWRQKVQGRVRILRTKVKSGPDGRSYEHELGDPEFRVWDVEG
ncbi:MAG: hypothetical protein ACTS10_14015 [Kiloniellales bacterium]